MCGVCCQRDAMREPRQRERLSRCALVLPGWRRTPPETASRAGHAASIHSPAGSPAARVAAPSLTRRKALALHPYEAFAFRQHSDIDRPANSFALVGRDPADGCPPRLRSANPQFLIDTPSNGDSPRLSPIRQPKMAGMVTRLKECASPRSNVGDPLAYNEKGPRAGRT